MTVHAALYTRLSTDATLGPLVSNGDSPETFRVYPMLIPQNPTYPLVRYQTVDGPPIDNVGGESTLKKARIQFDAIADDFDEAHTIADAIDDALTASAVGFKARRLTRFDLPYDNDVEVFRVTMDYSIWYT